MRKLIKSIFILSFIFAIFTANVFASSPSQSKVKPNFIKAADAIVGNSTLDPNQRIKELEKQGWVVSGDINPGVSPNSSIGCASSTNQQVMKQYDEGTSRWVYLIQANFLFVVNSSCIWDTTSGNALDAVGLAVVDQNSNSVNAQAEYASIQIFDFYNQLVDYAGAISSFSGSGLTGTVTDSHGNPSVGGNTKLWFYIVKPTSGTSYYVRSNWTHTWTSTVRTLQNVSISYPYAFNVTWSNNEVPSSWTVAAQTVVTFN